MPPSSFHPEKFWPVLPLLSLGFFSLISFMLSRMGWCSFAERYPAKTRPTGMSYASPRSWFGRMGPSYSNVVRVTFTDAGVFFNAMFLFRAFHSPFLVPWASVRSVEKKDGFWGKRYRLDIEDPAGEIHVLLPARVEHDLFRYYHAA